MTQSHRNFAGGLRRRCDGGGVEPSKAAERKEKKWETCWQFRWNIHHSPRFRFYKHWGIEWYRLVVQFQKFHPFCPQRGFCSGRMLWNGLSLRALGICRISSGFVSIAVDFLNENFGFLHSVISLWAAENLEEKAKREIERLKGLLRNAR